MRIISVTEVRVFKIERESGMTVVAWWLGRLAKDGERRTANGEHKAGMIGGRRNNVKGNLDGFAAPQVSIVPWLVSAWY